LNYHVVYEVSRLEFSKFWVAFAIMAVLLLLLIKEVFFFDKFNKFYPKFINDLRNNYKKSFQTFSITLISVMILLEFGTMFAQYQGIVNSYYNGRYLTVEGKVSDFKPVKMEDGREPESFKVNDISFEYSSIEMILSYNTVYSKDGVIMGNGQKVRIGYVKYGGRNHIVRIETKYS
jgi:hypothetical protein